MVCRPEIECNDCPFCATGTFGTEVLSSVSRHLRVRPSLPESGALVVCHAIQFSLPSSPRCINLNRGHRRRTFPPGLRRYDAVIHMVTAAEGAEAFYNLDNPAPPGRGVPPPRPHAGSV